MITTTVHKGCRVSTEVTQLKERDIILLILIWSTLMQVTGLRPYKKQLCLTLIKTDTGSFKQMLVQGILGIDVPDQTLLFCGLLFKLQAFELLLYGSPRIHGIQTFIQ